jgi:signal transduction histidine kinase
LGRTALFQGTYELNRKSRELEAQKLTLSWQRNFILLGIAVAFVISVLASFYFRSFNRVRDLNREIEKQNEEIIKKSEELTKANAELAVLNQDISEQKEEIQAQAEELTESHETIIRINQHLEEKVAERTSELAQAYKELDTFFYRASHDFRRPLTTFMGLSEVAKITVKDENALELFEKVRLTASNLDKMLMKLQSISDVGLQQLSYREVFSNDIFNVLFTTYGDEFGSKDVSFQTEASIASFYSYPTIIKLIVDNLVENAIQFRRQRQAFVKVKIYKQDSEIIISVIDNGQGIDAQYQDQIFNMYFRGSENSNGNGLGLYIIKKAVEKLNGRISFTSVYNSGSTFSVFFPTEKS